MFLSKEFYEFEGKCFFVFYEYVRKKEENILFFRYRELEFVEDIFLFRGFLKWVRFISNKFIFLGNIFKCE